MTCSVILTCYNQVDFIEEALRGILYQLELPEQVIVADDGSIDGTQDKIREFVSINGLDNWLLLLSPTNRGINQNLQEAIMLVTSDILIGMAGDDVSLDNRIVDSKRLIFENDADIICLSGMLIDRTGNYFGMERFEDKLLRGVETAVKRGFIGVNPVGFAIRMSLFSDFGALNLTLPNEDDQIAFRALLGKGLLTSSIVGYKYRIHSSSQSSWLRDKSTVQDFLINFNRDIHVRRDTLVEWKSLMRKAKSGIELQELIDFKLKLYSKSMHRTLSIEDRFSTLLRFRSFGIREYLFFAFGGGGLVFYFLLRNLRRAFWN
jgi:glycosyltransferase involved in cell wall biosynthesis